MGVGKTTIGHHLANELRKTFVDSDHEIEKQAGVKIPVIFECEGELSFRRRERTIIAKLTRRNNLILSTGGGVVLNADNRKYLQSRGYVIYLQAPVDDLLERTIHNHNRPLLKTANPREKLETLLLERHPLYQKVADVTIKTSRCSIRKVVTIILKHLQAL